MYYKSDTVKNREAKMLYLLYIFIGILIIVTTNVSVTAIISIRDAYRNHLKDHLSFGTAFRKYFGKNNNIPLHLSDWKF